MRHNPAFASSDPALARELVRENPWAILVTANGGGLIASHCPLTLDESDPGFTLLTHLGRPDEEIHEIEQGEVLVIVQGQHGYISPSWYGPEAGGVPTWNYTVAHLHGVPQPLDEAENLTVLEALVDRFESHLDAPADLDTDYAARVAKGTLGLRIPVDRFELKRKLSQNKDDETRHRTIAALREPGPYQHLALAAEMERELG